MVEGKATPFFVIPLPSVAEILIAHVSFRKSKGMPPSYRYDGSGSGKAVYRPAITEPDKEALDRLVMWDF